MSSDLRKRSNSLVVDQQQSIDNTTKIVTSRVFQLVKTCRNCHMVYISDKKRVICPFCGSFYREKSVDEFLRKQERINDSKKVMIINFRK
jgi:hypothetical protein